MDKQNEGIQIPDNRNDLAVERTELALERTQLAWVRTTLAFIGSGIALDKGMEALHKARLEAGNALFQNAHVIGISLSLGATILISFVTWHFVHRSKQLYKMRGTKGGWFLPGVFVSLLIIILGAVVSLLLIIT